MVLLPIPVLLVALFCGPPGGPDGISISRWILQGFPGGSSAASAQETLIRAVILEVRLPRILLAFMVGAAMASSGVVL